MKAAGQVIRESSIPAGLIRSVIRQLGDRESLQDIARHGIDGGFGGFIYTAETVAFFKRNRTDICSLAEQMADDFGQSAVEMVASFGCLRDQADGETRKAIAKCLYGGPIPSGIGEEVHTVANALAWFAAEEVARAFCDE